MMTLRSSLKWRFRDREDQDILGPDRKRTLDSQDTKREVKKSTNYQGHTICVNPQEALQGQIQDATSALQ